MFPNLLLCMGLGCQMDDGVMVGCHISGAATEDAVLAELKSRIDAQPGTPRWLYMIADFEQHFVERKLSFTAKARAIGYLGEIFVLHTRPRVGTHGLEEEKDAKPYANGVAAALPTGSTVVRYSSFTEGFGVPGVIKTGDSVPRPGTRIPHTDLKIVRCL